jgi:Raf kinase inhibitor-like YbhB/YbcL family protein
VVALVALALGGCGPGGKQTYNLTPSLGNSHLTVTSPAFAQGQPIPKVYSCDGNEASPPLAWNGTPDGTKSLALILDDPDVPGMTWTHWVLYALPPTTTALPESVKPEASGPDGSKQGSNSWEKPGYGGPCPPSGTHRYFFRLYALDTEIDLPGGATAEQLKEKMQGHVLAVGELMGTYSK